MGCIKHLYILANEAKDMKDFKLKVNKFLVEKKLSESEIKEMETYLENIYKDIQNSKSKLDKYFCDTSSSSRISKLYSIKSELKHAPKNVKLAFNNLIEYFSEKEITNKEEFSSYVHNLMKNAHGDNYSEDVTNKTIEGIIKDHPEEDWGNLIGRIKNSFKK